MDMSPGQEMKTTEIHGSPSVNGQNVPSEPNYSDHYSDGGLKSVQKSSHRSNDYSPPQEAQDVFIQQNEEDPGIQSPPSATNAKASLPTIDP